MMSHFIHVYSGDSSGNGNPGIQIGRDSSGLNNGGFVLLFQKGWDWGLTMKIFGLKTNTMC